MNTLLAILHSGHVAGSPLEETHAIANFDSPVIWNANTCKTTHCWQCLHVTWWPHWLFDAPLMSCTNPQEEFTTESLKDKLKISTAKHTDSVKGKWGFFLVPSQPWWLYQCEKTVWKARTIRIYITPSMSKQYDCCCWCWINQINH